MTEHVFNVSLQYPGPWGFRLAGGIDFNLPLSISRITPGGKGAIANLLPNDVVLRIDGEDAIHMTHLDAQNKIKNCVGDLALTCTRGEAKIWKPKVTPVSAEAAGHYNSPAYNVSLKSDSPYDDSPGIGASHNVTAQPFPGSANVVHLQYNSPVGIYSASNIAETFKGQTEGLITGVVGGEGSPGQVDTTTPAYQSVHGSGPSYPNPAGQSRSFKMLQEMTEADQGGVGGGYGGAPAAGQPSGGGGAGFRSVRPPAGGTGISNKPPQTTPMCEGCDRGIVGPFVKVKGKSYHPECFTCAACHCSLKNQGYFDVGGKLYCERDARERVRPPPGCEEVAMPGRRGPSPSPTRPSPSAGPGYQQQSPSAGPGYQQQSPSAGPGYQQQSPSAGPGYQQQSPSAGPGYQQSTQHAAPPAPPASAYAQQPGGFQQRSKPLSPPHQYAAAARGPLGPSRPLPPRATGIPRQTIQRGAITKSSVPPGTRTPICDSCGETIRGPFVNAIGKNWHPDHFHCSHCSINLMELGFVEENNQLFCEKDYTAYFAPNCAKCQQPIVGDVLNALEKTWHPDCFVCVKCHQPFSGPGTGSSFHVEDGMPYCENDWNKMFTTKCSGCNYPIEPGDKWVEALDTQWHSGCFTCTVCHVNLEGQSFYAKGGRPYCRKHASG